MGSLPHLSLVVELARLLPTITRFLSFPLFEVPQVAKKIAVIDDSRTFVELMQSILQREGYEVLPIVGSAGAFERVKRERPSLVILDIMMPGQSGWEVLDQLQFDAQTSDIPIIISTAVKSTASRLRGQRFELLRKPFDIDVLLSKVEAAIGRP